ncbi:MAG: helix-turn-helix domain-containing protein [Pseudomonadota bacterium]
MFHLERRLPSPALRDFIDTYYFIRAERPDAGVLEDTMLPELPNIRIKLSGDWDINMREAGFKKAPDTCLFGFTHGPYRVRVPDFAYVFGIGLKPLGWQSLIARPAADHADQVCDLAELLGANAETLRDNIAACETLHEMTVYCDQALPSMLGRVSACRRAALTKFLSLLESPGLSGITRVNEFAEHLGLSMRQAERASQEFFGCSPKLLLRKHRFLSMLARSLDDKPASSWLDEADESFYDQSHYIREYKRFTGRSPREFAKSDNVIQAEAFHTLSTLPERKRSGFALRIDICDP